MIALDDLQIVAELICVGSERRFAFSAAAQIESAGHRQQQIVRHVAERVDADVRIGEEVLARAVDRRPIEREAERVHRVGAEDVVVAQRERLRQVVAAADGRRQHVVDQAERRRLTIRRRHVAAEQRMIAAPLVIELADGLTLVDFGTRRVVDAAARIGRRRQVAHDRERRLVVQRRADRVVREWRAKGERPASVAGRRRKRRPVAREHLRRRNERDVVRRRLARVGALISCEEEQLVVTDRTAQHAAVLVPVQSVVLARAVGVLRRERIGRIEIVIAQELERVAVHLVGSRTRDRVDGRARVHAVLRAERARLDLEFLERVGERQRQVGVVVRIVVRRAVEQICHARRLSPGDRDQLPALHAATRRDARRAVRLYGRSRERDQIYGIPAVERQRENALVFHHLSETGVARLDERRRRLHRDRLLNGAERQVHVDDRRVVDLQDDARAHVRFEARQVHVESIRSNRQVRQCVRSICVRDGRSLQTSIGLRRGHVGARQHAAAGVLHDAGDLSRRSGLRVEHHAGEYDGKTAANDTAQDALHQTSSDLSQMSGEYNRRPWPVKRSDIAL